ncbi:nitrate- and nitrite sensing domain-containing protein [Erwinia sp. MMLR14_017]|uniref:nitrate- and nitrite sensing domain-containing protein n=1 Tax=Erwinia sp. MMLR14_017 TaxID=3093842 RepID=UPI00299036B8|nr:nitrate- and nitrite sensing domain-containing protein [Erwinia sp. MMLR14_017]MDW8847385.1 nitrate- and nitrite sensing domain-containing protein [Erwinia sp. MMLR14_017]
MSGTLSAAHSWLLASQQCERAGLQNLLQTGRLTDVISQLIHELQRERGASNIWLCSQGQLFGEELPLRAQQVSQAINSLMRHLPPLPSAEHAWPGNRRLFCRIATALHAISELAALREGVRLFRFTHSGAMDRFSYIIRQLLNLVFETIDTATDRDVSRAQIAMFTFMQGKELAGQERAIGSAGFAAGLFSPEQSEKIVSLIASQERCFASFVQFADAQSLQKWRQVSSDENDVERLRRIACTRSQPEAEGNEMALRWFQLMSRRIDGLKSIEDGLAQQLLLRCRDSLRGTADASSGEAALQQKVDQLKNEPAYTVFVASNEGMASGGPLETDGLMPELGRSVLGLVQEQSQRLQAQDDELAAMRTTLNERKVIDRAKAMLMQHHAYSEEQAWQILRKMAMDQNRRMVDIASALLSVAAVFPTTSK